MEHYTEKQYDDDLTVVADEYDDSFQTDNVDLFEFPSYDESPLARLKSLVLSIDWEITDEVLRQFNDELVDLKDIWAGEKIYLVYIQALEKISKYIYQEKADSNPNAIKLLLALYYNLEKMVSSDSMTEEEKRELLLEDVKKFELLKKQIGREKKTARPETRELYADRMQPPVAAMEADGRSILTDLKAIVLGIDWEITETELEKLRDEVQSLEGIFADSRPKQIFLQGLGTLASYIRLKKSDAHPDAFKLLHSFFAGLEKIVIRPMTLEEEKEILFPEVEKFNAFKAIVGSKIRASRDEGEELEDYEEEGGTTGALAPALSGFAEEERGFQEEEEAAALGIPSAAIVENQIDRFFSEGDEIKVDEMAGGRPVAVAAPAEPASIGSAAESRLEAMFKPEGAAAFAGVDHETALQGVNVETEADDDSGEERLPLEAGELAPALAALDEEVPVDRRGAVMEPAHLDFAADVESRLDDFFKDFDVLDEKPVQPAATAVTTPAQEAVPEETVVAEMFEEGEATLVSDRFAALQGVDVETEDDDDSGEEPLAFIGEDLAPALAGEAEGEDLFTPAPIEEPAIPAGTVDLESGPLINTEEQLEAFEAEAEPAIAFEDETEVSGDEAEPAISLEEEPGVFGEETEPAAASEERLEAAEVESGPAIALEEQLDAFFALEEEEPPAPVEVATSLAPEPEPEIESEPEPEPALVEIRRAVMEQPTGSMFVMEVLEEGGEEEVVFELAEEEEETSAAASAAAALQPEAEISAAGLSAPAEEQPEESVAPEEPFAPETDVFTAGEPEFLAAEEEVGPDGEALPAIEADSEYAAVFEAAEEPVAEVVSFAEAAEIEHVEQQVSAAAEDLFAAALPGEEPAEEPVEEAESAYAAVFEAADESVAESFPFAEAAESEPVQPSGIAAEQELAAPAFPEEESTEELVEAGEEFFAVAAETPLAGLRACVSSLGLALDDSIFQGMYAEINALRGRYFTSPIAKTFLQLLSTITQHIDQYRYESSSEAFDILQSVCGSFEEAAENLQGLHAHDMVLREITRVLLWQKDMLDRQAVSKGDELTFAAPVRTESGQALEDEGEISFTEEEIADAFPAGFEPSSGSGIADEPAEDDGFPAEFGSAPYPSAEDASPGEEITLVDDFTAGETRTMDEEAYSELEQELAGELLAPAGGDTAEDPLATQLRDIIRGEMEMIRKELQVSLESLRKEMLGKKD
ncbi:MAG: hypothetical protein F9K32_16910 [Desulfobulbaceae bacterium]|nr:MAG: hypothetical protein F9K32_16910 [Desulfobulbaceae bacterium]